MKKIIAIILTLAMVFCFVGCSENENIEQTDNKTIKFWIDEETGVQYVIYSRSGGYSGMGGITPRLNKDGSLYVQERDDNAQ